LKITYKTKKLEKICTDVSQAEKKHGKQMANIIEIVDYH